MQWNTNVYVPKHTQTPSHTSHNCSLFRVTSRKVLWEKTHFHISNKNEFMCSYIRILLRRKQQDAFDMINCLLWNRKKTMKSLICSEYSNWFCPLTDRLKIMGHGGNGLSNAHGKPAASHHWLTAWVRHRSSSRLFKVRWSRRRISSNSQRQFLSRSRSNLSSDDGDCHRARYLVTAAASLEDVAE